jgi:hypothetical protein
MKKEDFQRLEAICKENGFTIESYSGKKTAIIGVKEKYNGSFSYYSVLPPSRDGETLGFAFHGFTDSEGMLPHDKLNDAGKFLAIQLYKYLNDEL